MPYSGAGVAAPGYTLIFPGNVTTPSPQPYSINELPSDDKSTLINIKDFRFTINHSPCNRTQPLLLMLVHSAPENSLKRHVVRETWGQQTSDVTLLFLVGYSGRYQSKLEEENKRYQDLIQGNFLDAYRNMTYKHVMGLKWATYYCPSKSPHMPPRLYLDRSSIASRFCSVCPFFQHYRTRDSITPSFRLVVGFSTGIHL